MVLPSTLPVAPLPVGEFEFFDLAEIEIALPGGSHDGVGQRMFARPLDARGQPQNIGLVKPRARHDGDHLRLAFGQRARLVDHQRVDLLHALERFGVLDQHAGLRAAPDADHDRHRRGKAERTGAGDNEHADGSHQAERHARLGPKPGPGAERDQRHDDNDWHEPAGNLIGQPLDRRARALRVRHHLHDLGQQRVAADLLGAHDEAAGLVERAGDDLAAGFLGDGHGFAGHQRFVERGPAFEDDAIHRHLLTRTYPQPVADGQRVDFHLVVGAIVADPAGGFWCELKQRLDRAGCRLARAKLKHLAEQHEHGNDGRRLEIDRNRAAMAAEGGREDSWRDRADDAVGIGHAGAHRDQREHVEIARDERLRATHEERPAGPQHHGRGEHELDPIRQGRIDPAMAADQMPAHLQNDRRQGKHEPDPEAARHIGEFRIRRCIEARDLRLQRHAADRAASRADLADLRMHRAGVDRAFRHRGFRLAVLFQIGNGIGGEFGPAAGRAEMIGLAAIVEAVLAGRGIYGHAADRIADGCSGMGVMIVTGVVVAGVAATAAAGTLWRAVSVGVFSVVHHSLRRL